LLWLDVWTTQRKSEGLFSQPITISASERRAMLAQKPDLVNKQQTMSEWAGAKNV